MVDFLRFLIGLSLFAAFVETALYLAFNRWYYAHGPRLRREEWQSTASVAEAQAFVEEAAWEGPLVGRMRGDLVCLRLREWTWGLLPRVCLRFEASDHGAVFICETRPFFGVIWLFAAAVSIVAADIHIIVGVVVLMGLSIYSFALWRMEARRVSRLAPLRGALADIGVRICLNCRYDLHGLGENRPCPECGHAAGHGVGPIGIETIRRHLDERAELRRRTEAMQIALGIPLCLVGPVVIGTMLWAASSMLIHTWLPWWLIVSGLSMVMIPLLFRMERKTGGDYLSESMREISVRYPDARLIMSGEYLGVSAAAGLGLATVIMNPGTVSAMFVEVFLAGPRMVLRSRSQRRMAKALERVDKHRTAEVVSKMLSRVGGMPPEELLKDGARIGDVLPSVTWLSFYGWIGVTAKVDRVFLFTESREALRAADS
jgi:hypothetical protein